MIRRALLSMALLASLALPGAAGAQADPALTRAVDWLLAQQLDDGGFSNGFAPGSDLSATADAALALAAAGRAEALRAGPGGGPLGYLEAQVGAASGPGQAAKLALAALAAGLDPRAFGGTDLVAAVLAGFDPATGFFGSGPFDSALSILALAAAAEPQPVGAVEGLLAARLDDGSFSFSGDRMPGAGDSNTTALAIQALIAAGDAREVGASIAYLRAAQNADGGWTYQKPSAFGEDTDANSTALAIQALLAAGEDLEAWGDPAQALLALQQESGAFAFNAAFPDDNLLATVQAIPALAGMPLTAVTAPAALAASGALSPSAATAVAGATLGVLVVVLLAGAWLARRGA